MKTIEEKAKAYDEALERAKQIRNGNPSSGTAIVVCEEIFPELRESEDERIIRAIIDALYSHTNSINLLSSRGYQMGNIEAWLEKHKYDRMKPVYDNQDSFESALGKAWKDYNDSGAITVDGCEDNYVECAHAKGFREGYLFGLEKQKEYHIPWYDYQKSKEAGYTIVPNEEYEQLIKQKEQKPVEMDNEEIELSDFESELFSAFSDGWQQYLHGEEVDVAQWAKEHSARLLNAAKQELKLAWSEEDERILKGIIGKIDHDQTYGVSKAEMLSFLKRLRPSWKPSEEQMNVLLNAEGLMRAGDYPESAKILAELYVELKKL